MKRSNSLKQLSNDTFKQALHDYLFLCNRDYPEKPALKVVGDRYRLSRLQRMVLYRGVTSAENVRRRKARLIRHPGQLTGKTLHMDGYNVLYTLMNYLLGKVVFIGLDGILRDIGGGYGKIENQTLFYKGMHQVLEYIGSRGNVSLAVYLDLPVPGSTGHAQRMKQEMEALKISGDVHLVLSADDALISTGIDTQVIATSDSRLIDAAGCSIYDIARETLEKKKGVEIFNLDNLTS